MTYNYSEATAVIGPLSPTPLAGAFDLCMDHAHSITVPVGWQMVKLVTEFEPAPPSSDDLMALANAIRETSRKEVPPPEPAKREVRRVQPKSAPPHARPKFSVIEGGAADDDAANN